MKHLIPYVHLCKWLCKIWQGEIVTLRTSERREKDVQASGHKRLTHLVTHLILPIWEITFSCEIFPLHHCCLKVTHLREYVRRTGCDVLFSGCRWSMSSRAKCADLICSMDTWRVMPSTSVSYTLSDTRLKILWGLVYGRSKAFFAWWRRNTWKHEFSS